LGSGGEHTAGKLANGKDADPENVLEILRQLKQEYPDGTLWEPHDLRELPYYGDGPNHGGVRTAGEDPFQLYACGGWTAMVSDRIFGLMGAPAREVTDPSMVRYGDIIVAFDACGQPLRTGIASESAHPETSPSGKTYYCFTTCSSRSGYIHWSTALSSLYPQSDGCYCRAWTRYPN